MELAKTERGISCVRVVGDGRKLELGRQLNPQQLEHLRQCVLATLQ